MNFLKNFLKNLFKSPSSMLHFDQNSKKILPPPAVFGMKVLDKKAFDQTIAAPSLFVPIKQVKAVVKHPVIKEKLFKFPCANADRPPNKPIDVVTNGEAEKKKHVLLFPGSEFTDDERKEIADSELDIDLDNLESVKVTLRYENYSHMSILNRILGDDKDGVRGFTQAGHIVHLNLREEHLPYKSIIGEVLLDKVKNCRTVVNKQGIIDSKFREFNMELLAGESDFVAVVTSHKYKFKFDFSKVFWNSRLQSEHQRITALASANDVVFDMFAGVGPFAVPLSKKGCKVHANDLNPESYRWLNENAKLNKASYDTYQMDAAEFAKAVIKPYLIASAQKEKKSGNKIHALMNLPKNAVDFLHVFNELIKQEDLETEKVTAENIPNLHVHCYTFASVSSTKEELKRRFVESLKSDEAVSKVDVHCVRNVAPYTFMYCLSAPLSFDILVEKSAKDDEEPHAKRLKVASN